MRNRNYYIKYTPYDMHDFILNELRREYEWFESQQEAAEWWAQYKREYPEAKILEAANDEMYKALTQYCERIPAGHIKPDEMLSTDAQIVHAKREY